MFIKIRAKQDGMTNHYDARLVENKRINGKVKPFVNACYELITADRILYLSAAYTQNKAKCGDDERSDGGERLW